MMAEGVIDLQSWKGRLDTGKQGPKKNITNLMMCLRNIRSLGPKLAFNDLTGNIEWHGRELKDSDYVDIRLALEADGFEPNAKDVPACVMRTAEDRTYNPVTDYLDGLKWDGKSRIDEFFPTVFKSEDTEINRAFGRMFLIGAVARAYRPGCKLDTMPISKGGQGTKKTTAWQTLFGEEYVTGSVTKFSGEQTAQALQGIWAVDLGELEALNTSVLTVKNFISLQRDRYKPPYGRHYIWRPRRMVFVGDTNEDEFLRDPTGARRFWPFDCNGVDIDLLKRHRDQLWAEAVRALNEGEQWWIDRGSHLDKLATEVQKASFKEDAWAGRIDVFLAAPTTQERHCVTIDEIEKALGLSPDRIDEKSQGRIVDHLRHLGWWKHKCMRHSQNRNWWFPPDSPETFKQGRPRGG